MEPKDGFLKVGVFTLTGGNLHGKAIQLIPILDQPLDVLSSDIHRALKQSQAESRRSLLIIPRSSLIIRYLTIPSQRPHEIREMLELGLHQYIPYEVHEVSFDFRIAEDREDGFSKILLFSVLESLINEQLVLCERAGVEIQDVLCSTEAAWRSVMGGEQDNGNGGVKLLIDIDALSTDVIAYQDKQLKFTRAISIGARSKMDDPSPERFIEQLAGEVVLSLETFNKEFPKLSVSSALVNGPEAYLETIARVLQRQLECKVSPIDLKRLPVVWNQGSGMLSEFKEKSVSYLSLVGGALLALGQDALSFLPTRRREEQFHKEKKQQMILAGGALLGALACIALFFIVNIAAVAGQLSNIRQEVKQIEAEANIAERAFTKLKIIGGNYKNKNLLLDMIHELTERTPEGVTLTQILLEEGSILKIRGLTAKNQTVTDYLSRLEQSELFRDVKNPFAKRTQVEREEFFDFQIILTLARGVA